MLIKKPRDCDACRQSWAGVVGKPDCDDPNGLMWNCPRARLKRLPFNLLFTLQLAKIGLQAGFLPQNGGLLEQDLLFFLALVTEMELQAASEQITMQEIERASSRLHRLQPFT